MRRTGLKSEIIQVGQIGIRFPLESADTNGAVAIFEFTVPAGAKVPVPHSHQHYDETIYGVAGVVTFTVEGKPVDIGPGDSCFIPRGAVHGFNNLKQTDAKGLAIITPALLGRACAAAWGHPMNSSRRPNHAIQRTAGNIGSSPSMKFHPQSAAMRNSASRR